MALGDRDKRPIVRGAAAYLFILLLVVVAARLGVLPGSGATGTADGPFTHPYRLSVALSGFILAVWLGTGSAVAGAMMRRPWLGLALLAAGGVASLAASAIAPAILYPSDRYPVAFAWFVGGVPVACSTWLAATIGSTASPRATSGTPA